jgi:glycosyltransferase involved in cell wall biosynthesis
LAAERLQSQPLSIDPIGQLTVVMPAYNEADSLPDLLPPTLAYCAERDWRIVLVDDGSTDLTRQVLEKFRNEPGLTVIHHKLNRGYGGALKSGLLSSQTLYTVTFDADGQHELEDIDQLMDVMLATDADLVVGSRFAHQRNDWYRSLGKWVIRVFTRLLMPVNIMDLNSGFKLYRTEIVQQYVHLCPDSMSFSDIITLIMINQRHLVIESPVKVHPRIEGRSTINTWTAVETMVEILNILVLFNPMRIFLPASIISVLLGLIWGIPIVLAGRGVSVGSMLAIVVGVIFFFLGLITEQLSLIRKGKIVWPKRKS